MSAQQYITTTPIALPEERRDWEVRTYMVSPHRYWLGSRYFTEEPTRQGISRAVRSATRWAYKDCYPGNGRDSDGRRIVAFEAVVEVLVVAPDGTESVVDRWPEVTEVVGWELLEEYEERERMGHGVVEQRGEIILPTGEDRIWWVWLPRRRRRAGTTAQL